MERKDSDDDDIFPLFDSKVEEHGNAGWDPDKHKRALQKENQAIEAVSKYATRINTATPSMSTQNAWTYQYTRMPFERQAFVVSLLGHGQATWQPFVLGDEL